VPFGLRINLAITLACKVYFSKISIGSTYRARSFVQFQQMSDLLFAKTLLAFTRRKYPPKYSMNERVHASRLYSPIQRQEYHDRVTSEHSRVDDGASKDVANKWRTFPLHKLSITHRCAISNRMGLSVKVPMLFGVNLDLWTRLQVEGNVTG